CTAAAWCARWRYANARLPWSNPVCSQLPRQASLPRRATTMPAARAGSTDAIRLPGIGDVRRAAVPVPDFRMAHGSLVDFTKSGAGIEPHEIDRRVCSDSRQPVRGFLLVLELLLVLQRLD